MVRKRNYLGAVEFAYDLEYGQAVMEIQDAISKVKMFY